MSNTHDDRDGQDATGAASDAGAPTPAAPATPVSDASGANASGPNASGTDAYGPVPPRPPLPAAPVDQQRTLPFPDLHDMPAAAPNDHITRPLPDLTAGSWSQPGASFGAAAQPTITVPLVDNTSATAEPSTRSGAGKVGAGKIAAVLVAALLIGGGAGVGGSYLGSVLWDSSTTVSESRPGAITVNNPGSVNETTAIAAQALPSVVTIEVSGGTTGGSGSGVILSDDGYVLTNTHVVTMDGQSDTPAIRVTTSDGRLFDATIVGLDPIYDLAVIKLTDASGLTPIEFADSSQLNVGDTTVAVGAPLGLKNTVTTGIVSALDRSISIASSAVPSTPDQSPGDQSEEGDGGDTDQGPFVFDVPGQDTVGSERISIAVVQTDAAINPGNSGGALVDSQGRLIGVNVAIATAGGTAAGSQAGSIGVGFAIPSNVAKRIADEIIENGVATHGLLGATVGPASAQADATVAGAYIQEVTTGGAAADAGLESGDIVTRFNGVSIGDHTDLTAQVRAAAAESEATLTYIRDGESFDVDVTLGSLPAV